MGGLVDGDECLGVVDGGFPGRGCRRNIGRGEIVGVTLVGSERGVEAER